MRRISASYLWISKTAKQIVGNANISGEYDRSLLPSTPVLRSLLFLLSPTMAQAQAPACKYLVLDAGPLLSLSPLRGLAETYLTVPQVLDELKDRRAREHFEQLGLSAGVRVEIRSPDANALARGMYHCKRYPAMTLMQ